MALGAGVRSPASDTQACCRSLVEAPLSEADGDLMEGRAEPPGGPLPWPRRLDAPPLQASSISSIATPPGRPLRHHAAQMRSTVFLARHGQTAYNLQRRFQGQLPVPLDQTGIAQAHDLARRASAYGFEALWASPLRRARETAEIVAAKIGLPIEEDPRLMETDAGDWTDRTFAEIEAESPDLFAGFVQGDPHFAFPGGESFAAQGVRVSEALSEIEAGAVPALVVCHGVVIRVAIFQRAGRRVALAERVPNAALLPLDPEEAEHADVGGGAALPPS